MEVNNGQELISSNSQNKEVKEVFDKVVGNLREFSQFVEKTYGYIDNIDREKEQITMLMNSFIKLRKEQDNMTIYRDLVSGDRVVISKIGLIKIKKGRQNGFRLNYEELFNLIVKIKDDKKFLKILSDNPELKVRVECFIKAIMKIPEYNNSYNDWKNIQKDYETLKFSQDVEVETYEGIKLKLKGIKSDANIIGLVLEEGDFISVPNSQKHKILSDKMDSVYMVNQLLPILKKYMEFMNDKVMVAYPDINSKAQAVRNELMPILTLEAF